MGCEFNFIIIIYQCSELIRLNLGKCGEQLSTSPEQLRWPEIYGSKNVESLISQNPSFHSFSEDHRKTQRSESENLGFNSRSASYCETLCKLLTLKPRFQRFEITVKMNRGLCTCHAAVNVCCLLFVALTAFSASTEHNPVGSLSAHHHEIQQHNRILLTSCPPSSCYYSYLCDTVGGLKLRSIRKTTAWMNPFPGKESSAEKTIPSSKT